MLEHIFAGAFAALTLYNVALVVVGLVGGIIAGMLPGITVVTAIALAVPFTFALPPDSALLVLGAIFTGAVYGGSNAAILLNTPGQPSSVVTALDGYPMTKNGEASDALVSALLASCFGGLIGTIVLLFFFEPLAELSLRFSPAAFFWLAIFGLTTIAAMQPGSAVKGLIGGAIGLSLSTVGLDPLTGSPRFTFGYFPLSQGLDVVVLMIGLFSFSQMLILLENNQKFFAKTQLGTGALKRVCKYCLERCKGLLVSMSLLGTFIGILPGAGGTVAAIIAYNEARRWSRRPELFGKGVKEGVLAPEAANNAAAAGSLIPMMALGIPGSASAAVLMGGLLGQGLTPGTQLLQGSADVAYGFIVGLFVANILMLVVGYVIIQFSVRILQVPTTFIIPAIVVLAVIGSFSLRNSELDVIIMLCSGVGAYLLTKIGIYPGAIALGIVLGPIAEQNLGIALTIAKARDSIFEVLVLDPISFVLIVLSVASLLTPFLLQRFKSRALDVDPIKEAQDD